MKSRRLAAFLLALTLGAAFPLGVQAAVVGLRAPRQYSFWSFFRYLKSVSALIH